MRRRQFLRAATLGGAAHVIGVDSRVAWAEPPPETRTLRLSQLAGLCIAPQFIAEESFRGEGFTEVQYVKQPGRVATNTAGSPRARTIRFRP